MDEPKAPDDAKNWKSIDIYLFSNGQQSSPPRKYHLRYEELKLWDATLCFLARSHYGSMQSNIKLYTLDGKKIGSPLELKNDMAYVAVKPPDAFISAGYKKYLIKASRSWEKRQENLSSNCAISKTGDNKCNQDCTKECIIALNLNKDVVENLCPNCETSMVLNESNNLSDKLRHKQDSKLIKKSDIKRNNSRCFKSNKQDPFLFKRKDTTMINKTEVNNHLRQLASSNHSISYHVNKKRQCKGKTIQKTSTDNRNNSKINSEIEVSKIGNGIVPAINNQYLKDDTKYKNNNISSKSDIVSNKFKNHESDTQSFLIDANQKLELESKLENIPEYNSINTHKNDYTTNLIGKKNQEQNTDFDGKERKLNIFLNINLKDYTTTVENNSFINRCNSELRVLSHRASQVNIDVTLSKGERSFKNNVSQIKKPPEWDANNNESIETTIDSNEVTVMRCECNRKNNVLTKRYAKEHSNSLSLLPIGYEKECSDTKEMVNKEIQVSSDQNNEEVGDKMPPQEESTLQSNFDKKFNIEKESQNGEKRKNAPTIISSHSDMFTQTDWCNVLLQAIRHEDGDYTFRLPTLALLKRNNIIYL